MGVALGYALSWFVVCLSTCVMASPAAAHACCSNEAGIRVVARDCCSVAPTIRPDPVQPSDALPVIATGQTPFATAVRGPMRVTAPVRAAASPPLILRI